MSRNRIDYQIEIEELEYQILVEKAKAWRKHRLLVFFFLLFLLGANILFGYVAFEYKTFVSFVPVIIMVLTTIYCFASAIKGFQLVRILTQNESDS